MRDSDLQREIDRMTTTRIVTDSNYSKYITTEPLLHPEQEPVAWRNAAIRLGEELSSVGPDNYYDMDAGKWLDWAMEQEPRGKSSLASQRTWVGLTEAQCGVLWKTNMTPFEYYQAIEAKLKEKNT